MNFDQCPCSGKSLERFLRPLVLALLATEKSHGYDLAYKLAGLEIFHDSGPDISSVYKTLRVMEKEGLVQSELDSRSGGPAKRCYVLTPDGKQCLRVWIDTLRKYRVRLDRLLDVLNDSFKPGKRRNSL